MAVPQLVWVDVEPGGSSPFPTDLPDGLACEMPIPPGTREDETFRIGGPAPEKGRALLPIRGQCVAWTLCRRGESGLGPSTIS